MRTLLLLPAAVLALSLSACGGSPAPTPTVAEPVPVETVTPTPEPEPAVVVDHIMLLTESLNIYGPGGTVLAEHSHYDSAADLVSSLTELLAAEPAVHDEAGGMETAPSTVYEWGGLSIIDYEGETIMNTDYVVGYTGPAFGDVDLVTYGALKVGDPLSAALIAGSPGGFPGWVVMNPVPVDAASVGEPGMSGLEIYTGLSSEGGGGAITWITAPAPNWGV